MSRHLVLLPAPEAEWAQLPPEEHEKGMRSHEQFHRDLAAGGHRIVAAGPLTPSAVALSMKPDGSGGTLVTDGPFTETVEQVVGFYLLDSDDRADLVRVCTEFASRGELIELRDMAVGDEPERQRPT
ncbi:MAG: YciI family protein [Ornithinibacter sp.]